MSSRQTPPAADGDDEHYLVIAGRRWRKTDPTIPENLRSELVHELMDARRAVHAAKLAKSAAQEQRARTRVQDAKLALGERGAKYWETPDEPAQRKRAAATIRALLTRRNAKSAKPAPTICPSDVARIMGGAAWRQCMPLVRSVAAQLITRGQLRALQHGIEVSLQSAKGPVRLALAREPAGKRHKASTANDLRAARRGIQSEHVPGAAHDHAQAHRSSARA